MTHFEHYKSGHVFGIHYRFDARGDRIPEHAHTPELAHNLVVMWGSVILIMRGERKTCLPGIHDFDWSQPHEIIALEDHCETLHLFLNGQPQGYDSLPDHELRGTFGNP